MPSAPVPRLTCLAYTHLLTEFGLNQLTPVIVVPLGSNLLRGYPIPSLNPSATRSWCGTSTGVSFRRSPFPSCGRSLRTSSKAFSAIPKFSSVAFTCSKDRYILAAFAWCCGRCTKISRWPLLRLATLIITSIRVLYGRPLPCGNLDSHETGLPGFAGLCFRSITNTPAPFVSPKRLDARKCPPVLAFQGVKFELC